MTPDSPVPLPLPFDPTPTAGVWEHEDEENDAGVFYDQHGQPRQVKTGPSL